MFLQGFLIGLVAGVWLTVLYLIIVMRGGTIRSYFRSLRRPPSSEPTPKLETAVASSSRPDSSSNASSGRSGAVQPNASQELAKKLDPSHLSSRGAANYSESTRLVHDEETAKRLIQLAARRNPDTDVEELIDVAIDKLLRDRGYVRPHRIVLCGCRHRGISPGYTKTIVFEFPDVRNQTQATGLFFANPCSPRS